MEKTAREKEQALAHPPLVIGLDETFRKLREKEEWHTTGRAASTLMKSPYRTVTLMAFRKGIELGRHHARGAVLLQVLSGAIRVGAGDLRADAAAGSLVSLDPETPHDIEALEECELLLVVIPNTNGTNKTESQG